MGSSLKYRRLRAPRDHGGLLAIPDWSSCCSLPAVNSELLSSCDFDLHGVSFQTLRRNAREDLLKLAAAYSNRYRNCDIPALEAPVIVSGHQPELFHPGVWAKHFATDKIARETGGVAIQILIDNDLCRENALRVPTGTVANPQVVAVPYDHFAPVVPYEVRRVHDVELFSSFARRVTQRIAPLVDDPLVQQIWPDAIHAVRAQEPLGQAIAQARHRLEDAWGLRTLEVPLSQLCETPTFRRFVLHLLLRGQRVLETHNRILEEYRGLHRMRSALHPVPNLRQFEDWTEAPFWMWTTNDNRRRPLWWKRSGQDLYICDRESASWCIEQPEQDVDKAVDRLSDFGRHDGLRIRPRALTNTLYARMFLCDLFVHGIGGSKYDQVTDLWWTELFPFKPPQYATLSLTLHLPMEHTVVAPTAIVETRQLLREMQFHPENFFAPQELIRNQVSHWIEVKRKWIQQQLPRGERLARHRGIAEANVKLGGFLQEKQEKTENRLAKLQSQIMANQLLESREWSFCLFPASLLREKLLDLGGSTS